MIWFGLAALICGEDLFFKEYVKDYVEEDSEKPFLMDKVVLTKFFNKGAMLGWLKDDQEKLKMVTLFGVGSLAGALMTYSGKRGHLLQKLGLSMMLGGAASNAYERIRHGEVTDYIRFNMGPSKFRNIIFNKGDFAVFGGGLLWMMGECLNKD
ncbi:MAG: signal peptidase II [Clostridia bacterium]|nr:signal peptidase II [Lachnospiraceae bacterium]NCB99887.1 signal peptidase II [Clostridia bacterium]NCD03088.1 signal peptidase II [Clostridia bacterium]